jgi:hypothetical protein
MLTLALGGALAIPSMAQQYPDNRGDQPQAQQPQQPDRDQAQQPSDRDQDRAQDQDRDRDRRTDQDRDRDQRPDADKDRDRDQHAADQDRDRDNRAVSDRDDAAFYGNKFFKEGWQDGMKHKHKNRKFKNDDDRRAYEAGYAHGDRGEQWHNPNDRDRDRH